MITHEYGKLTSHCKTNNFLCNFEHTADHYSKEESEVKHTTVQIFTNDTMGSKAAF